MMGIIFFVLTSIGGTMEYQGQALKLKRGTVFTGYSKIDMRISSRISPCIYFRTDIVGIYYHGKLTYSFNDFMPYVDFYAPTFTYQSRFYLQNAFLRVRKGIAELQVGRQQVGWGTGYAFNPSNVFQHKSMFDPTYELDGVDALRLRIFPASLWELDMLWLPPNDTFGARYGVRLHGNIGGWDISFGKVNTQRILAIPFYPPPPTFVTLIDTVDAFIGDFSGEFLGVGVHGEFLKRDTANVALVGMDYTLPDGLTRILIEYLRNEDIIRLTNLSIDTIVRYINFLSGNALSVGENELFVDLSRTMGFHSVELAAILNLDDGSGMIMPRLNLSLSDNASLILSPSVSFGKGEFASFPDGFLMRIRIGW